MTDEPFKVGDWAEYKGASFRIAAMDAFGFCLLKTREDEIVFAHAPARDFTRNPVNNVPEIKINQIGLQRLTQVR